MAEMLYPVCLLAFLHGLIHSSSRVILLDSSSGALWERQHSDLQGSLKNSVKMSAVIGFWIRAPAVCVDSSIFSLFFSISIMEVTLNLFVISLCFRYSYL